MAAATGAARAPVPAAAASAAAATAAAAPGRGGVQTAASDASRQQIEACVQSPTTAAAQVFTRHILMRPTGSVRILQDHSESSRIFQDR